MIVFFLFQSALTEFLRPRRTVVWVFVACAVCVAAFAWTNLIATATSADAYSDMSRILVYRLLPLVAAIFSSAVVTQEVAQKTIVYLVTRPIPRSGLVVARIVAASLVVFFVVLLCAIGVAIGVFGPQHALNSALGKDVFALFLGSFAYVALFVLLSLWANKAMLVCLLYAFGWETLVASMPGDLYYLSIYSHILAVGAKPTSGASGSTLAVLSGQLGTNSLTSRTSVPVLILVIGVCAALAAVWFANFEYVPREDTD